MYQILLHRFPILRFLDAFFSVAIVTNPHWKMNLAVNYPDICEITITPILGATKFLVAFSIFTSCQPIHVDGYITPTIILRLSQ